MKELSVATYAALKVKVRETLLIGQQKIEEAKVRTYWETGRLINEYLHRSENPNQEHGKKIVEKLAEDLGFGAKILYRCMQFAEKFPTFAARRKLSWAHYRALVAVPDGKKRLALADEAAKGEWSSRDLEIEIRNLLWDERMRGLAHFPKEKVPDPLLEPPALGPFFAYKIIRPETIHSKSNELLIDLGFSTVLELNRISGTKFKPDTIVTSAKDAKGRYSLRSVPSPRPLPEGEGKNSVPLPGGEDKGEGVLYIYQAFVERVIDGDTLKVEIDLGFNIRIRQMIRLRAIDCPEIDTPEGQVAKRFVERELAHCEFITVKSTQTRKEKWGRYLGDVFYVNKAGKQQYLNNRLLEEGHAVRVRS